ncbi:glycosyl hydrolase catalytic core-domain-containing protein [Irpex rosettiformis]|uniref:Glycosyl hydrolase catalytic core-domain-containing protein n=1 Tax=Irpex rosettiformis TaxID=378272 RepID=A0ACB8UF46_9APHY|nr:glycosyl hydrolase catalytic core-domain-containing protein [Irpex rosettiformis]
MAALKLLNLIAVISLALFASNLSTPANALSTGLAREHHLNRQISHEAIARRSSNNSVKRANNKRCKPKSSAVSSSKTSIVAVATSSAVAVTSSYEAPKTSSEAPKTSPQTTQVTTSAKAPVSTGSAPITSGGSGCNGKKLGIALDGWPTSVLDQLANSNAGCVYNWSPWAGNYPNGLSFAPMLWGDKQITPWLQLITGNGNGAYALSFNEPDQSGQSNMSPQHAVDLWWQYMEPKKNQGYRLVSPATTNSPDGLAWQKQFFQLCSSCTIHAAGIHVYSTDPQTTISVVEQLNSISGKPVVILENGDHNFGIGAQDDMNGIWQYWTTVMKYVKTSDKVESIFPFSFVKGEAGINPLNTALDDNGNLNDLGNYFVRGNW